MRSVHWRISDLPARTWSLATLPKLAARCCRLRLSLQEMREGPFRWHRDLPPVRLPGPKAMLGSVPPKSNWQGTELV
jgi:hypothetical protein